MCDICVYVFLERINDQQWGEIEEGYFCMLPVTVTFGCIVAASIPIFHYKEHSRAILPNIVCI